MAIDFKKKLSSRTIAPKTDPVELYGTLDRKSVAGPLRPAQEAVLSEWYTKRRTDKDLIIKLHTGEGKTLVGLLLLQSLLNSKEGPCLYICPNKYLVKQVCAEADKFGIPYCTFDENDGIPNDFLPVQKYSLLMFRRYSMGVLFLEQIMVIQGRALFFWMIHMLVLILLREHLPFQLVEPQTLMYTQKFSRSLQMIWLSKAKEVGLIFNRVTTILL